MRPIQICDKRLLPCCLVLALGHVVEKGEELGMKGAKPNYMENMVFGPFWCISRLGKGNDRGDKGKAGQTRGICRINRGFGRI